MILIGAGGHAKVIIDVADANEIEFKSIFDENNRVNKNLIGIPSIRKIDVNIEQTAFIAIGDNKARFLFDSKHKVLKWSTLIHPKSIVSKNLIIGEGTVIMAGAIIQPGAQIGRHCIINTGACIDHDTILEDFVHVAPNCSIAGGVEIGEGSFIGIGSSIIPNIKIGAWATIGAGSVVIKDVDSNKTVMGNPAKKKDMKNDKIWLSSPHIGDYEQEFVKEAFDTNWVAPLGPNVNGFEKDLSEYVNIKNAGAFTSGSASLHLSLILLGIEKEDEVICQSFTFSASANPIRYQGAIPVFVDSEFDTWNIDPVLLEQSIKDRIAKGKKPKAMIVVHLYGMPSKMKEIIEISTKYDIPIIEDAAEALGSEINSKKCGSFGKLNVLSFNGNKIITTSGGGALLSDDSNLIKRARFLATQARDEAPHYEHTNVGYNYRMSNILAGIGRGQMKVLESRISRRREIHDFYFRELGSTWLNVSNSKKGIKIKGKSSTGIYFLKEPDGFFSNRWLTTIIVNEKETNGISREDIRLELERHNIESRPLWKPMHQQPVFNSFPFYSNNVSDWLFKKGLCLPSGSNMEVSSQKRIIKIIKSILK